MVQNQQSLGEFLQQAPASLLVKYRDQSSVTERIRRILRRHLAEELPSLEAIGRQLAMTPQTLRRRLREEGQGFRAHQGRPAPRRGHRTTSPGPS